MLGQSYGGLLAQIIAKRHPDVVSGLLLTSTASFSTELTFRGMKRHVGIISEENEAYHFPVQNSIFSPVGQLQ